jgi:hypothetical protein
MSLQAAGTALKIISYVASVAIAVDSREQARRTRNQAEDHEKEILADLEIRGTRYKTAQTQDINMGYQNFLSNLTKTAPYYVSRYKGRLKKDYVDTINKREDKAVADQSSIHKLRSKPLIDLSKY